MTDITYNMTYTIYSRQHDNILMVNQLQSLLEGGACLI